MILADEEILAGALGLPIFRPPCFLPDYPEGECGVWRISRTGTGIDHGYYSGRQLVSGMPVLLRRSPENAELWETWMSLSPHEIESQEPGCFCALGHTVVMGLGMGWVALNAALNPAVRRVTVIEWDQAVIDLFTESGVLGQLPPGIASKVRILRHDALEWRPDEPVDFLYADIWRPIASREALADVRRMQRNIEAGQVYFWGQELKLFLAFQARFPPDAPLSSGRLGECAEKDLGLPLALPWGEAYGARILAAVGNRLGRALPLLEQS